MRGKTESNIDHLTHSDISLRRIKKKNKTRFAADSLAL